MGEKEAQGYLQLARQHLERVQAVWDSDEPEDKAETVVWAFYAYENAVVAVLEKLGMRWQKTHRSKEKLAAQLHRQGILSVNVGPEIARLNEARKDVQYGELSGESGDIDLEDLASDLEAFVDEVDSVINTGRKATP